MVRILIITLFEDDDFKNNDDNNNLENNFKDDNYSENNDDDDNFENKNDDYDFESNNNDNDFEDENVSSISLQSEIQNNMITIIKNSIFQAKQGHIFQIIPIFCYSYGLPIQIGKH